MIPPTAARRRALRSLVESETATSQRQLVEMLAERGHVVTQATVSRDLDAIGAVKQRDERGVLRYMPAGDGGRDPSTGALARTLADFVEDIRTSGNLAVVKTAPGAAHVVGSAIDVARLDGVIGTVAGDDTLLVVATEQLGGGGLMEILERIGAGR
jgi:transcriptional regulator of arginine metabolism